MFSKSTVFILLFFCISFIQINGQDDACQPGLVRNLQLSGNSTLSWDPPLAENCDIDYYLVVVFLFGSTEEQFSYTVTDTTIDLSHLNECIRYSFQVTQVTTANVTGPTATLHIVTPPSSEAELALDHLNVTLVGRNIRLNWGLKEQWVSCAQRYRVVIYNSVTDIASDIYTQSTSVTVTGLVPCASYTFTVSAIFTLLEEGPPAIVTQEAPPVVINPPKLQSITLKTTSVDLILVLPTLQEHSCSIDSIRLTGFRNASLPIRYQNFRTPFSITLTGLVPSNLYYLQISANNTAGFSHPLHFAFQTLPDVTDAIEII